MTTVKTSAPGKVILFGEHFVVYGNPAIACAIQKRSYCEISPGQSGEKLLTLQLKDYNEVLELPANYSIRGEYESFKGLVEFLYTFQEIYQVSLEGLQIALQSELPPGMGLGSSASVLTALAYGLNLYFSLNLSEDQVINLVFEGEKIYHGNPSGIDNTLCAQGGVVRFQNGQVTPLQAIPEVPIVVINSGIPRSTRGLVEIVRKFKDKYPNEFDQLITDYEDIVASAQDALQEGNTALLGKLMDHNHELLREVGVSHPKLDQIYNICHNQGALGAKLTGAGGGGCLICLIDEVHLPDLEQSLLDNGLDFFRTQVSPSGMEGEVEEIE